MKTHYRKYNLILIFLAVNLYAFSQKDSIYKFSFITYYELGFQAKKIQLYEYELVDFNSNGLNTRFCIDWRLTTNYITLQSAIGYRLYWLHGKINSKSFSGHSNKLIWSEKISIQFAKYYSTLLGFSMTNNFDFKDFRSKKNDLLRLDLELEFSRSLHKKWNISLLFSRALTAKNDVYLVTNALNRIQCGIQFKI